MAETGGGAGGPWDPGLQPERTTLAWVRTGMTLAVVSLLLTRLAPSGPLTVAVGLGGMVAGTGLVVAQARRHHRSHAALRADRLLPAVGAVGGLTAAVVLLAASAVLLVLVGRA